MEVWALGSLDCFVLHCSPALMCRVTVTVAAYVISSASNKFLFDAWCAALASITMGFGM